MGFVEEEGDLPKFSPVGERMGAVNDSEHVTENTEIRLSIQHVVIECRKVALESLGGKEINFRTMRIHNPLQKELQRQSCDKSASVRHYT